VHDIINIGRTSFSITRRCALYPHHKGCYKNAGTRIVGEIIEHGNLLKNNYYRYHFCMLFGEPVKNL
jgi:hypothetical protein